MKIAGLHHITIVCSDAQQTVDFYTGVLGLRLVKQTVNFDAPDSYHLYFGDYTGSPGSAVTFFEWRGAPQGRSGIGGAHHFALRVADYTGLLKWKRRLVGMGLNVTGPFDHRYFQSIYFRDPDGLRIEIATDGPGWSVDEAVGQFGKKYFEPPAQLQINQRNEAHLHAAPRPEPQPVITPDMALTHGMHHITAIASDIERTHAFLSGVLGLERVKMTSNFDDPESTHWYWGVDGGQPGTVISYFEKNAQTQTRARMGAGQTHHLAFAVADEEMQLRFRDRLVKAGCRVSPVMERIYFKSIYTTDPDGHIIELATAGPGFAYDEDIATLGGVLKLPPWLESQRATITAALRPLQANGSALR